jgi:hypothetical protein
VTATEDVGEAAERARLLRELEKRHRDGYAKFPPDEFAVWDRVTAWPDR